MDEFTTYSLHFGEEEFRITCPPADKEEGLKLLRLFYEEGTRCTYSIILVDTVWYWLSVVKRENIQTVVEPDFSRNPYQNNREDIHLISLFIRAQKILDKVGIRHNQMPSFRERLKYDPATLNGERIFMTRRSDDRPAYDSGWYIGTKPDRPTEQELYNAKVYAISELMEIKPGWLDYSALPEERFRVELFNDELVEIAEL